MNYSIYLFPKLIHMYYVCYLDPKLPGTGYWMTRNLFFWGMWMPSVFLFLSRKSPLQDRLLCFEERHLSCSLAKGIHKPGLEGRYHSEIKLPQVLRALVSRMDKVPCKLSVKARAVQTDIFTL